MEQVVALQRIRVHSFRIQRNSVHRGKVPCYHQGSGQIAPDFWSMEWRYEARSYGRFDLSSCKAPDAITSPSLLHQLRKLGVHPLILILMVLLTSLGACHFGYLQWAEQVTDMFGLNYNYEQYDPFHKQYPKTPFISSESCSCTSDRDYEINATDALLGPEHAWSCIKDCWQPIATRDWVQGSFGE